MKFVVNLGEIRVEMGERRVEMGVICGWGLEVGDDAETVVLFAEPFDGSRQGVFHVFLGLERVVEDDD